MNGNNKIERGFKMKTGLYFVGMLLMFQIVTACNGNKAKHHVDTKLTKAELQKSIAELVRDKGCNSVGQCRSIAYGAKACGGPTSYLIYSTSTDEAKLSREVNQYNHLVKKENIKNGTISNCSMLIPPTLDCKKNRCIAVRQ